MHDRKESSIEDHNIVYARGFVGVLHVFIQRFSVRILENDIVGIVPHKAAVVLDYIPVGHSAIS